MTKKVRTYSNKFKAEAVKKIADNNGNISATAKQLGIAMQTLNTIALMSLTMSGFNQQLALITVYLLTADITTQPVVVARWFNAKYAAHPTDAKDLLVVFDKGVLH